MKPNKLLMGLLVILILVLLAALYFTNKESEPRKVNLHQPKEIQLQEKELPK